MDKNLLGYYGEITASRYLRRHGYLIVDAQYSVRFGEIDLIAEDKKYIVFVEVKSRSEGMMYAPADAVDFKKRSSIIAAAKFYLSGYTEKRQPRFDIIEVYFKDDRPVKINHIENAFDADGK